MKYKIGWIAQQFGITPQSIRYYEKEGIFSSGISDKGATRQYFARNFKWLSGIRQYLMMEFTTKDIRKIYQCSETREVAKCMRDKYESVEAEVKRLRDVQTALARRISDLERIESEIGTYELTENPPLYVLINQDGQELFDSAETLACIKNWAGCLPYVDSASVVDPSFPEHRNHGFCVYARDAERLGLSVEAPVKLYKPVRCVRFIAAFGSAYERSHLFDGLLEYVKSNSLEIEGYAFGRCLVKTGETRCLKDFCPGRIYYEYWVPVGEKS